MPPKTTSKNVPASLARVPRPWPWLQYHQHCNHRTPQTLVTANLKNFFMLNPECSRNLHTITPNFPNKSATFFVSPLEACGVAAPKK